MFTLSTAVSLSCNEVSCVYVCVCVGKHHHKVDKAMYTCYAIISGVPEAISSPSSRRVDWNPPLTKRFFFTHRDIPRTAERPRDGADGDPEGGHGAPVLQLRDGGQREPVLDQVVQGPAGVLPVRAPRDALDEGLQRRQWHRGGGEFTFSNCLIRSFFLLGAFKLEKIVMKNIFSNFTVIEVRVCWSNNFILTKFKIICKSTSNQQNPDEKCSDLA